MFHNQNLANTLGIKRAAFEEIIKIISNYPQVINVYVFGSRAKGNYKTGSDLDLAISGKNITHRITSNISYNLNEESCLPYFFDVLHLENITSKDLLKHIQLHGIKII